MVPSVRFLHTGAGGQHSKKSKKGCEKGKRLFNWVVCPKIALRESLLCGKMEKLGSNHTVKFSKTPMRHPKKSGKEGSIAKKHSKMRTSGSEFRRVQNSRQERKTKPQNKAGAPAKTNGNWQRMLTNSTRSQKIRSTLLPKLG